MTDDALPPLKALAAFRAAGTHSSFQEAARALGLTPSAISHQVRLLEDWLGVALFERHVRAVALTAEGRLLLKAVDSGFGRIGAATASIKATNARRPLRVSTLPLFTQAWLIPRLHLFTAKHPDIEIILSTQSRLADLAAGEADISIRNVRMPSPLLISHKLLDIRGVAVVSRALKSGKRPLERPEDLAHHTLIHISARADGWPIWLKAQGVPALKPRAHLSVDTVPAALDLAAQGLGVALGMDPIVWEAEVAKDLVPAFAAKPVPDSAYYAAYTKARRGDQVVQAFIGWLLPEMAKFKRNATRR